MNRLNKLTVFGFAVFIALALLTPLTLRSQLLTNVYYINAVQGNFYAINVGGQSYRVFYIDNSGNTVYITAYWWDANTSYIIFQAPITGKVYLRQESYTLSTLNTLSWINAPSAPKVNITTTSSNANFNNIVLASNIYSGVSPSISYSYDGSRVSATYTWSKSTTSLNAVLYDIPIAYDTSSCSLRFSASTTYSFAINLQTPSGYTSSFTSLSLGSTPLYFSYYSTTSSTKAGLADCATFDTSSNLGSIYYWTFASGPSLNGNTVSFTTSSSTSSQTFKSIGSEYFSFTYSTSTTYTKTLNKANNVITYDNGNKVYVYDSLSSIPYANMLVVSSSYTYYLYTQDITIGFSSSKTLSSKALVIPLDTSSISNTVKSPNPAVYYNSLTAWVYGYLINYGFAESFLVFPPLSLTTQTLSVKLIYNYPIQYTLPPLQYVYKTYSQVIDLFAVQGSVNIGSAYTDISGNITLSNFLGSTILLRYDASSSNFAIVGGDYGSINNNYLVIYVNDVNAVISGNIRIYSALVLYNVYAEKDYTVSVGSVVLQQFTMDKISYTLQGEITGSWSYRVPIYITLSELPSYLSESGFVFRLELPLQDWVKAGLLSPALEDLMITDSNSRPLPFYVLNATKGIVYVRYTNPIYSSSIVIYVLLKNTQLWGTGNSFSTLNTFDAVNSKDFVDDFGYNVYYSYLSYNAMAVITSKETTLKFGKTWFDFVGFNNTKLIEQHGSTVFYNTTLNNAFKENDELLIYINRQNFDDILVYKGFSPLFSFRLSNYASNPAYYIGYKDARAVYVFRMLMYSYSVGQLVGGYQRPQEIQKPQQQISAPQTQIDWFTLFMTMMVIVVLGLVIKWVSTPSVGERKPITLP